MHKCMYVRFYVCERRICVYVYVHVKQKVKVKVGVYVRMCMYMRICHVCMYG